MSGPISVAELAAHLRSAAESTAARYVLGVAGPPGAGKSTLALALRDEVNRAAGAPAAQIAPMDGFHLDNRTLADRGLLARKGEPDTFDAEGFIAALTRLRASRRGEVVPWPTFDRDRDTTVAAGVVFERERIAIVEGNYLLVDDPFGRWSPVRKLLDESWFLDADSGDLVDRLVRRYVAGGRSPQEARDKVFDSDMSNMRLIEAGKKHADVRLLSAPEKSDQNCAERGHNGYVSDMKNDSFLRKPMT